MPTKEVVFAAAVLAALALAAALAGINRLRRIPAGRGSAAESGDAAVPDFQQLLCATLERDLALAAEHVRSIRCLLEIARQHEQPIPTSALTNLELVSKHLDEMQRRIGAKEGEDAAEAEVSAPAHRRELRDPPRPPRLSSECRVSPCDISRPCD